MRNKSTNFVHDNIIIITDMSALEIILGCFTALFGAGNVWQFFTVRSLRRKSNAEADQAQIQTLSKIIETYSAEYASLQTRYDKLQDKYDSLVEKYDNLNTQLIELRQLIGKK